MPVYELTSDWSDPAEGFVGEACNTLRGAVTRVKHAVHQLSDDDLWWRPHPDMNAAGNIMLHLCGNLSQWVLAGVGGEPFDRDRDGEFAVRDGIARDDMLARFDDVTTRSEQIIASLAADDLTRKTRIQGFDTTVIAAVMHAVSHLEGHAQELIYIARLRRGSDYQFLWDPGQIGTGP